MPTNVCVPFFKPGQDVTGYLTTNVGGKTCVATTGTLSRGGQPRITTAAPGAAIFGVLGHDGVTGEYIHVNVGGIVPILTAADVTTGTEVQVGAGGAVIPLAAGRPVGYVVAGAASGNAAAVKLYG